MRADNPAAGKEALRAMMKLGHALRQDVPAAQIERDITARERERVRDRMYPSVLPCSLRVRAARENGPAPGPSCPFTWADIELHNVWLDEVLAPAAKQGVLAARSNAKEAPERRQSCSSKL